MNQELKSLLELQEMDKVIDAIRSRLDAIPGTIEDKRAQIRQAKALAEEQKNRLVSLQVRKKEKEVDIASRDEKMRKHEGELNSLKSNEAYRAMMGEIEAVKRQKAEIEDEILNLMVETDQASVDLKNAEAESKKIQAGYEAEIREMEAEAVRIQASLDEETRKRAEFSVKVPGELLSSYDYIRERKRGVAIVTIQGDTCNGCNTTLTPNTINQARKGKEVVRCESCSRILFVPSAAVPSAEPVPPV